MKNTINKPTLLVTMFITILFYQTGSTQKIIENYQPAKKDSLQIGTGKTDFLPFIRKGYTLYLPKAKTIKGVLVFLEDSGFDKKNKSAQKMYNQAGTNGFAVLSVSTSIPLDFFFSEANILEAHQQIQNAFYTHKLPNKNVFFAGVGLSGHRVLKYVAFIQKTNPEFKPGIVGLVICDAPLDWVRQYNEGARDIRINFNKGSVWEGTMSTYLLSKYLKGTPKTNLENYLEFSPYSYFDEKARHIKYYKEFAVRTYMQVAIEYWLEKKRKTPFDNNGPDMVGLIAELRLTGNQNSELVIIYPEDSKSEKKNIEGTWLSVDKEELMQWIIAQINDS